MKKFLFSILSLFYFIALSAQSAGDYRTVASGNWNNALMWQSFDGVSWQPAIGFPSNTDGLITIRNTHTITVNVVTMADELVIDPGGSLSDISTLTLVDGAGTDLTCNGTLTLSGTLSGAGSGIVNTTMHWTGGSLGSSFTIAAGGVLNISGGATKTLSSTLANSGNVNWSGGTLFFSNATLTNSSIIDNSFDGNLSNLAGTNLFSNLGTFSKTAGTATNTIFGVPSNNSGTININSGTILKSGVTAMSNTGTINITTGTTFSNTSILNLDAGTVLTGDGTLVLDGTVNINAPVNSPVAMVVNKPNGAMTAGTGLFTVNGTLNWTNGTVGSPFRIAVTGIMNISSFNKSLNSTLTNDGTINWSASSINFNNGTFTNNNIINNSFDGTLSSVTGTNSFINNGTFDKSAGTGTTSIGVPFTNNSIINISTGTVTNNGAMNLNTGTVLTGNGTLLLSTTVNINANFSSSSTLTISKISGTTAGTGIFTVNGILSWTGGTLGTPFTIGATGIANLSGAGTKTINTTLTNNGILNWSGGVINNNNGTLNNSGTINNSFDGTINNNVGSNTLNNAGTFNKTGGSATTTLNIPVTNTGIFRGQAAINFTSTFVNNGSITPGISALMPGILTLASVSPLLIANSSLNINILDGSGPGTGHSQLVKASNLVLNGTLNVLEVGTVPLGTYTIINLTAGTISGNFASVNIPPNYALNIGASTVSVTKLSVLSVSLFNFKGRTNENYIDLSWQTSEEENFSHFTIERSEADNSFYDIGRVAGKGFSTGIQNYTFADRNPAVGNNLYRLKMVDLDGTVKYSNVVKVFMEANKTLYISISNEKIIVHSLEKFKQIQVIDMSGRIVKQFAPTSDNQYPISDLKKGIYVLKLTDRHIVQSKQFIKH